jgi:hypothetical protein
VAGEEYERLQKTPSCGGLTRPRAGGSDSTALGGTGWSQHKIQEWQKGGFEILEGFFFSPW